MVEYKPPSLGYPGGKARVAKKIIDQMPPHTTYVEPFAGAAHVFFAKPKSQKNVLNDTNSNLMGLFRDLKGKKVCCDLTASREKFERLIAKPTKNACEWIYLNKNARIGRNMFGRPYYGNKHNMGTKCYSGTTLDNVHLESKDFRESIRNHDSSNTLFYVDPPYVKPNDTDCQYGKGGCEVSPDIVADSLKNIKGKFIVSYDDHPSVRKAFKSFKIDNLVVPYSMAVKDGAIKGKTKELLITNYRCKITKQGKVCEKIK